MRFDAAENQPEGRWIITRKSYKLIDDKDLKIWANAGCNIHPKRVEKHDTP